MRKLNDITFIKTNGGLGRTAASEDPISGLIFGGFGADTLTFGTDEGDLKGFDDIMDTSTPPAAVSHIRKFEYKEELADAGIVWTKKGTVAVGMLLKSSSLVKSISLRPCSNVMPNTCLRSTGAGR